MNNKKKRGDGGAEVIGKPGPNQNISATDFWVADCDGQEPQCGQHLYTHNRSTMAQYGALIRVLYPGEADTRLGASHRPPPEHPTHGLLVFHVALSAMSSKSANGNLCDTLQKTNHILTVFLFL